MSKLTDNTNKLLEILEKANSLPPSGGTTQKYGKLVVFGDSVGYGENNNGYSFVNVLEESGTFASVVKACVSGATVGPYQEYAPAAGYDLLSQIERYASDVRDADIIICEYGGNDVVAALNGTIQMGTRSDAASAATVCGYIQRAIDRIRALNPAARIHWTHFFPKSYEKINLMFNDIFSSDYADAVLLFAATAMRKISDNGVFIIHGDLGYSGWVSSDGLHPNTEGQEAIASIILNGLFRNDDVFPAERLVTLNGDLGGNAAFTANGKFAALRLLIENNVPVRMRGYASAPVATNLFFQNAVCNQYMISFSNLGLGATRAPDFVNIALLPNETIEMTKVTLSAS